MDPAWNEYDAPGVLARLAPADDRLAALAAEFEQAPHGPDRHRKFQRFFEAAMLQWLEAGIEAADVEPWPVFRDRVSGAIRRVMAGPPGRRVGVFTSGGPIGLAVQIALKAPARSFLEVNWRIRNASLTGFTFDRDRLTLDSFNCIPHLDDDSLLSYR